MDKKYMKQVVTLWYRYMGNHMSHEQVIKGLGEIVQQYTVNISPDEYKKIVENVNEK